jgi:hypothetical protein
VRVSEILLAHVLQFGVCCPHLKPLLSNTLIPSPLFSPHFSLDWLTGVMLSAFVPGMGVGFGVMLSVDLARRVEVGKGGCLGLKGRYGLLISKLDHVCTSLGRSI